MCNVPGDTLLKELRIWRQAGNSLLRLFVIRHDKNGIALYLPRYRDGQLLCIGRDYQNHEQALAAYGQLIDRS